VSQFNPSTNEHVESNGVTKNVKGVSSPVGNQIGRSTAWVMMELEVPSRRRSRIGGISEVGIRCFETNFGSTKQCEDPQSIRARNGVSGLRVREEWIEM
jgi:hypothetical protein